MTLVAGGVRGSDDLRTLDEIGCDAAPVASALQDGRLARTTWLTCSSTRTGADGTVVENGESSRVLAINAVM